VRRKWETSVQRAGLSRVAWVLESERLSVTGWEKENGEAFLVLGENPEEETSGFFKGGAADFVSKGELPFVGWERVEGSLKWSGL